MRKVYKGNGLISHWTKETVFSDYGVFDIIIEKDTFYFTDGEIDSTYTGQVYRKGEWKACTRGFDSLQELLKTFRTMFC